MVKQILFDLSETVCPKVSLQYKSLSVSVVLDRIPWVAPEVLETPDNLTLDCDKWSFGATLWEIFNSGEAPLPGWDLDKVFTP